jgi:predicted TIM-barrel fold metal-dependent hydrolase
MVRFGEAISADSHVTEPEAAYATIDRRYAHRAPRRAEVPGQGAAMVVDPGGPGERLVPFGRMAMAGRTHVRKPEGWAWDELHPGGFDPLARLDEMERDGVAAEVIYPTVGMVLCNHPDRGYQRACFAAYNRWLAEWCATDPARLVGIGQTAARAPDEAVADVEEILALGLRGVMLPGFPGCADWHHPDWDPLWAALADLGVPASFHILTSGEGTRWRGPGMNGFLGVIHANQDLLGALVLGGVLARHPGLRVVCVEADAGWVPHFGFRMDSLYARHRHWVGKSDPALAARDPAAVHADLPRPPSTYLFEQVYVTFQDDEIALRIAGLMNRDRLMWASDHPHSDATWPESERIRQRFATLVDDATCARVLRDNCAALYGIDGAGAPPSPPAG